MSTPAGPATTWGVAAASRMGSLHVREHLPNQDSVRTWTSDDGSCAIVTVADGHGHHAHFRSDVGADLATSCALDVLRGALADAADPDLPALGSQLVDAWRAGVTAHLEAEPFGPHEAVADPLIPYGATLLAVAVTPDRLVAVQIGDGDTVAVRPSGEAFRPLAEDLSLDGIHTASLCQRDPLSSFRYATLDLATDPVALVYVTTDGFGKARVDADGWWRTTGTELVGFVRERGLAWVAEQLPSWIEEPAEIGGDDTTLALLVGTDERPAPPTVPIPLPDLEAGTDEPPATIELPVQEP